MNLERITIHGTIFLILMSAFTVSTGGVSLDTSMNAIFAPFPSIGQGFKGYKNCGFLDVNCNADNVAAATAGIAFALEYPGILIFTFLDRINRFGSVVVTILFGPQTAITQVPYLNILFLGLLAIGMYELFRMFRGNASAGTG